MSLQHFCFSAQLNFILTISNPNTTTSYKILQQTISKTLHVWCCAIVRAYQEAQKDLSKDEVNSCGMQLGTLAQHAVGGGFEPRPHRVRCTRFFSPPSLPSPSVIKGVLDNFNIYLSNAPLISKLRLFFLLDNITYFTIHEHPNESTFLQIHTCSNCSFFGSLNFTFLLIGLWFLWPICFISSCSETSF